MRSWILRVTFFVCVWAAGADAAGELQPYTPPEVAPALALVDLSGQRHDLKDYRGQVVLVNFWGTWCPPCLEEMPSMERLYKLLAGRPFAILAVNVKQPQRDVARFTQRLGVTFPVLLDPWGQTQQAWKVKLFPTSFLVGPDGGIHYAGIGALEWDAAAVVDAVEALMPESAPTGP